MRLVYLFILCIGWKAKASDTAGIVFRSGDAGYHTFRIPAIIRAPNQSLLAFSEGRVNHAGDFGDIKIVLRSSTDNGKTWLPIQVVTAMGNLQVGNPAPVVDLSDSAYPRIQIFLFYNSGNHHKYEIRKGNGLNCSSPINIISQVHRPHQPHKNPTRQFYPC
ncbi:MAG: exo-alpha-sialidase [Chitinophagaceae bacterium]|nr:exo-alpha-sialidase [Chitinophagaceae bacterium]